MPKFLARESEMETLERHYHSESASFVVIYGRRRVGKTALISEFLRKHDNTLYLMARDAPAHVNLDYLRERIGEFVGTGPLASGWRDTIASLRLRSGKGRIVVAIDEFQYLARSDPSFLSEMQDAWDTCLKDLDIMLIVCGSHRRMMESQLLDSGSPLYGRRTAQMMIRPIPFSRFGEFFPDEDERTRFMLYAVTGGIPKYMELYRGGGIMGFIKDNILDPDGYLYPEAEFLLSREVTDTRGSIPLMAAIAGGCSKMEEIAGRLGVRQTDITRTLSILRETGLVARDIPATETSRSRSRRGLYRIADGYMRFWLMYVYPFQDMLESRHPEYVIRRIGETMDTNFMPAAYEDVCRESVWGLKELEGVITPTRVGRYWGRDAGETDVVVLDDVLKKVMVGECKYSSSPKDIRMLEGMQEKLEAMASLTGYEPAGIVLFSMSGFTEGMRKHAERDGIILVSGPGIPVSSPGTMEIDNSGSLRVPREIFYRPPFYDTA